MSADLPEPLPGFVEAQVRSEFPGLRLDWTVVPGRLHPSPPEVKSRLAMLSNRYRGASVIAMRTQPIPHAYRAFFRQVGLDPETTRIPSEEAAVHRLLHGHFRSVDLLRDALLIALVETGIPVWALDAAHVDPGGLGIRTSVAGDSLGKASFAQQLPPGQMVVADAECVHALLFGKLAPEHEPTGQTTRIALFAVGVEGVPGIHIDEALWVCADILGAA